MKLFIALLLAAGGALAQNQDAARVGAALAQIDAAQRAQLEKAAQPALPALEGSWMSPAAAISTVVVLVVVAGAAIALRRRK